MVCRLIDGFDYYNTADITRKWTDMSINGPSIVGAASAKNGAGAIEMDSTGVFISRTFDNQVTWIVGFAFHPVLSFSGQIIVRFMDVENTQCSLIINSDGTLEVVRGTSTTVTDGQSVAVLTIDTYQHVEMKVTISNSIAADSCIVRLNETEIINVATGQDLQTTTNSTANRILFSGFAPASKNVRFDDLYIFDGTDGPDTEPVNNDFAGNNKVLTHWPDGNGSTNDFVGSDGNSVNNYLLVQEVLTDDDTTYVESTTPGEIDLYEVENLKETALSIEAIQVNIVIRKDEAGISLMRSLTRPLTTNFAGATVYPSFGEDPADSYVNEFDVYDKDPETDLAWTESGFNATEFGVEIVS